jgi:flagellar biosynthesis/type III secretory pathway M-ring protein FliF/YscJ
MGFLGQVATQVKELYGRLTFSQKLAFVLLIAVVVAALMMFTNWGARGEYVRITREPLGSARAEIVAALDAAGVDYREAAGSLDVASSQYNTAMAVLATHGIVPTEEIKIRLADIAKEDRMFRTSEDKRAQRLVVLQNWLGDVISHMENIRGASAGVDAPDGMGLMGAEERGTAAVHVWLEQGVERLGGDQVNGIAALVAGVRRTIKKSDVRIVDNHGHEYRVPGDDESAGVVSDRQEQQMMYERRLAREVRDMLCYYNPVKVMVRLKIDFDRKTEEVVDVDPEKVVEVETRRDTSETTTSGAAAGAGTRLLPGAEPPGPAASTVDTKDSRFARREIYKKVTRLVKAPGDVLDVSVSVFVPREQVIEQIKGRGIELDEKAADERITEEADRIKTSIVNMLLVNDVSKITVQAVTFPKPKLAEGPVEAGWPWVFWEKHGRTTVLAVLSLVALVLLWRLVRKPVEVAAGPGRPFTDEDILTGIEGAEAAGTRTERIECKVQEIVRESPADAAGLVSRWVQSEG